MKAYLIVFIALVFLSYVSADIIITEMEMNPLEGEQEWAEIYNDGTNKEDLSAWALFDGLVSEKVRHVFEEGFELDDEEYFIVEFSSNVLNNNGDYLILYTDTGNKEDGTDELSDLSRGTKTWQLCHGDWKFLEETRGEANTCEEDIEEEPEDSSQEKEERVQDKLPLEKEEEDSPEERKVLQEKSSQEEDLLIKEEPQPPTPIVLGTKDIKSEEAASTSQPSYGIYFLVSFGLLIGALLLLGKQRYTKNEFGSKNSRGSLV